MTGSRFLLLCSCVVAVVAALLAFGVVGGQPHSTVLGLLAVAFAFWAAAQLA